ncbi:MAG: PAS domain-containing protein [Mucilaginibacter polytrichastri]|nr:PAS domain-containing protein [Mucilaginibacter polytrichastri]
MPSSQNSVFQAIFDQLPEPRILVSASAPDFPVVAMNAAYERESGRERNEVIGKPLWEIFKPESAGSHPLQALRDTLDRAARGGGEQKMSSFRYDLSQRNDVPAENPWWQIKALPVADNDGAARHILLAIKNINTHGDQDEPVQHVSATESSLLFAQSELRDELISTRHQLDDAQKNLSAQREKNTSDSEYRLRRIVETTPIGLTIFRGRDFIIDMANQPVLTIWGRTGEQVLGKKLMEVFPELDGQPFPDMLRSVMDTGKTIALPEIPVTVVMPDGDPHYIHVDFSYDPLFDHSGKVDAVLVSVKDISENVQSRLQLQERQEELEAMNEEMASINEEYLAANEELMATNEELSEAQDQLTELYENFVKSRQSADQAQEEFSLAISTADLGTWRIDMKTHRLTVSDRLREIFGFTDEADVTVERALQVIEPEFVSLVEEKLNEGLQLHHDFDLEFPLRNLITGQRYWVRSTGRMFFDHDIPKHFSGVFMDITERKLDDIRKNDFIGIVSHELKTPLTSVKGYLQLINRQAARDHGGFFELMSEKAIRSVSKMEGMVKGFLNVARFGSGKIYLDKHTFVLHDLIEECVSEYRSIGFTHTILYEPCEEMEIFADREKIGQVLNNFLSNALKYSPDGSEIVVTCEKQDKTALVSVSDQGMGIREEDLKKLFERFYRVNDPANSHITGFGIGLYLCSEIIQRHDGRIWAESRQGKGSVFYFEIPLA